MTDWTSNIPAESQPDAGGPVPVISLEDAVILKRCREGEVAAFGQLVMKYQDRLFNAILRMCGNRDDAEELCQETFVKALENLARFREDSGFYTWLFRIGMNLAISRRRRGGRVKFHSLDGSGQDDGASRPAAVLADSHAQDPAEEVARDDADRRVLEALAELAEDFRAVVVLRDIEEMDYEQISQVLEIPVGTVKSRLYRARCMLQEKLKDLLA